MDTLANSLSPQVITTMAKDLAMAKSALRQEKRNHSPVISKAPQKPISKPLPPQKIIIREPVTEKLNQPTQPPKQTPASTPKPVIPPLPPQPATTPAPIVSTISPKPTTPSVTPAPEKSMPAGVHINISQEKPEHKPQTQSSLIAKSSAKIQESNITNNSQHTGKKTFMEDVEQWARLYKQSNLS